MDNMTMKFDWSDLNDDVYKLNFFTENPAKKLPMDKICPLNSIGQ